ncbi:hypothetical protein LCGC14_2359100 [marine sediment metagenome]|uniref:Uncharacterized protein n=1 Tax=marine sediment metagenome TaxID=412755 RepID=A0A0F9EJK9_9ZZZZ
MAQLKTLDTYKATWDRIRVNPKLYLDEHVNFQNTSKPIKLGLGVFELGTTARACSNYKTFHQSVDELNRQILRNFLNSFIGVHQRLPKKGEKILCTIRINVSIAQHKWARAGRDATILITGEMIPKV